MFIVAFLVVHCTPYILGGHGAFLSSTLNPDRSVCSSIAAGWIRKEEYGNANNFFGLDVQNSFVEPGNLVFINLKILVIVIL